MHAPMQGLRQSVQIIAVLDDLSFVNLGCTACGLMNACVLITS